MKSKKILLVIVLLIVGGGVGSWWLSKKPKSLPGTIEIKKGESFSVVLEANPTTGYQWELDFDPDYIQLIDREYAPSSPREVVGAGGQETFNFLALKSGKTEITFSYLRPWEKEAIKKRVYKIIIK